MHFDFSDPYQHRLSVVHRLDPRVKVVATLLMILAIGITPEGQWWAFWVQFLLLILAVGYARLGLLFTIRRSFIALPFILAALAVPFTVAGPELYRLPLIGWSISETGLVRFLSILLRAWLAVQVAILLTASTRVSDLFWALGALRLPRILVATISFMYRYLFVLADEASRMLRARASRCSQIRGRRSRSLVWQGRVAGSMVGNLFLRSLERSERVYAAMLSRGYDGQIRTLRRFHMGLSDWIAVTLIMVLVAAMQIVAYLV